MNDFFCFFHGFIGRLLTVLLLISLVCCLNKKLLKKLLEKKLLLFVFSLVHFQFLLGIIIFFLSEKTNFSLIKEPIYRFFTIEHPFMAVIFMSLFTIGYVKAKKNPNKAQRYIFIFWGISLCVLATLLPWKYVNMLSL